MFSFINTYTTDIQNKESKKAEYLKWDARVTGELEKGKQVNCRIV